MSNSGLVSYTNISPNKTSPRNHKIDTITIHCVVGQLSAKQVCDMFANSARKASSNYVIGKDGEIGLSVDEKDRSWCSTNAANDHRAITIECASDTNPPYTINNKVYNALIRLLVDICRRNSIPELKWRNNRNLIGRVDQQNMTVHRWFANKSCPGDYIFNRLGKIANDVNVLLEKSIPKFPFWVKATEGTASCPCIKEEPDWDSKTIRLRLRTGIYTIIDQSGNWGRLEDGSGWIPLPYVSRINERQIRVRPNDVSKVQIKMEANWLSETVKTNVNPGLYTITEQKGNWGKLKSGIGWIPLPYVDLL